jgi:hypothetical protein
VEFGGEDPPAQRIPDYVPEETKAEEPFERSRPQVVRDEYGYPRVMGQRNTTDPGEMVGQQDVDEDGVGSL